MECDMQIYSDNDDAEPLVPARDVLKRYSIVDRTLDRWLANTELKFPRPLVVNRRRYFRERALTEWERQRVRSTVGTGAF
jgi:hypothetical protein